MTVTLDKREDVPSPSGPEPEPPQPANPVPEALQPWHDPHPWRGWLVTLLVGAAAGFTRFWSFGFPGERMFDEAYYTVEAQEILRYGYEDNRGYMFIVHPPLGKWLIAAGEWLWAGDDSQQLLTNSVSWRIAPAVAGVLTIVMLTRIARRMFRSDLFGALAGLLLTMEGVSLVLGRTAILDIFLQLFVLAAFGALVKDRDQLRGRLARLLADGADLSAGAPGLGPRPWRLVAGVMIGCACAVKWTGVSFFGLFVIMHLLWDRAALRAAGVRRPWRNFFRRSFVWAPVPLFLVPIGTYLFCWLGWFAGENSWNRHWADTHAASWYWSWVPGPVRALAQYHVQAYQFHEGLDSPHTYGSKPWSWLVLGRPVDFYYNNEATNCGSGSCSREVLLIGTPLLWWGFIPALLWLAWHYVTTRDWRAGAVFAAFVAGYVVWFDNLARTMFLFYMAPLVPFLVLALTMALGAAVGPRKRWGTAAVCLYLGVVVADFAWMWPLFTGGLRSYDEWHAHMWFDSWV